jgi:hypothetical protein
MKYTVRFFRADPESQVMSSEHELVGTFRDVGAAFKFLQSKRYTLVEDRDDKNRYLKVADRDPFGVWKKSRSTLYFYAQIHEVQPPPGRTKRK